MRRFFDNKSSFFAVLFLFVGAFIASVSHDAGVLTEGQRLVVSSLGSGVQIAHGPTVPPDPWNVQIAHGPTVPPDPWNVRIAHGPTVPPDPWNVKIAHGPTVPPDPWNLQIAA